jgi:hypothetical protein
MDKMTSLPAATAVIVISAARSPAFWAAIANSIAIVDPVSIDPAIRSRPHRPFVPPGSCTRRMADRHSGSSVSCGPGGSGSARAPFARVKKASDPFFRRRAAVCFDCAGIATRCPGDSPCVAAPRTPGRTTNRKRVQSQCGRGLASATPLFPGTGKTARGRSRSAGATRFRNGPR